MNCVFISPEFPENYYLFCRNLKKEGVTVLAIGQADYAELRPELRDSLS